jgi:hypothetical protein
MKTFFTPEHIALLLLITNTFLKGLHDAWDANKDKKGTDKVVSIILDTLLYATAGKRAI